ncbi:MAG: hypothetical protein NZM25_08625 [Leptospiraceae bacterium]|nr:hypothetical protein [Leptospiraceae bacterium]MDW8306781.1 hypothetical protein [Leptospiraceae bacterium]
MQLRKLRPGEYVELSCKELVPEGLGLCHLEKEEFQDKYKPLTAFVWGALPGERLVARIARVHSNHFFAILARKKELPSDWVGRRGYPEADEDFALYNLSPLRQKPPCPNFTLCGGCKLLHLPYEETLNYKIKWLALQLAREKISWDKIRVVPSPKIHHYRNHVQVHINAAGQKGFYAPFSYRVMPFPAKGCLLFDQELWEKNFPPQYEKVRCVRSRIDFLERQVLTVPLYSAEDKKATFTYHVGFPQDTITKVTLPNTAFFQINLAAIPLWLAHLASLLKKIRDEGELSVLELFSGFGFITRMLAYLFPLRVVAIDILKKELLGSVRIVNDKLGEDRMMHFLDNYYEVDLYDLEKLHNKILPVLKRESFKVLLINPPRAGLGIESVHFFMQNVTFLGRGCVIYSSCNPATLARDLAIFYDYGYQIEDMVLFDFFPFTSHSEVVVFLQKV